VPPAGFRVAVPSAYGGRDRHAVLVEVEQPRIDVRRPRDRRAVAQEVRDLGESRLDRAPPRRLGGARLVTLRQRRRGDHGRVPGQEVLRGEVLAGALAQVVVQVPASRSVQ
jgi:hypothetical protein